MSAANEQFVQLVRPGETDPWKEHVANHEFEDWICVIKQHASLIHFVLELGAKDSKGPGSLGSLAAFQSFDELATSSCDRLLLQLYEVAMRWANQKVVHFANCQSKSSPQPMVKHIGKGDMVKVKPRIKNRSTTMHCLLQWVCGWHDKAIQILKPSQIAPQIEGQLANW